MVQKRTRRFTVALKAACRPAVEPHRRLRIRIPKPPAHLGIFSDPGVSAFRMQCPAERLIRLTHRLHDPGLAVCVLEDAKSGRWIPFVEYVACMMDTLVAVPVRVDLE